VISIWQKEVTMAVVDTQFMRITAVGISGGEGRLISPGALNTDYKGTFNITNLAKGDAVRIIAWGVFHADDNSPFVGE
jgi:hypothetical protein